MVDEEAAKRFWPGVDPVGKRITFDDTSRFKDVEWVTVIGVVGHMAHEGLDAERRVQLHFPHAQWGETQMRFCDPHGRRSSGNRQLGAGRHP